MTPEDAASLDAIMNLLKDEKWVVSQRPSITGNAWGHIKDANSGAYLAHFFGHGGADRALAVTEAIRLLKKYYKVFLDVK